MSDESVLLLVGTDRTHAVQGLGEECVDGRTLDGVKTLQLTGTANVYTLSKENNTMRELLTINYMRR